MQAVFAEFEVFNVHRDQFRASEGTGESDQE
jgi:hypothetical protein